MTLLKHRLVSAHRAGDWEAAKLLSQEKEREKRQGRGWCEMCGIRIRKGRHCRMHDIVYRYYRHALPLIAVLLAGCHPAVTKPQAAAIRRSVVAYVPVRTNVTLAWDYMTNAQYSFNVYGGTEPRFDSFRFITNVKNNTCTLSTDHPRMFFSVKVLDNFNLMESGWATK